MTKENVKLTISSGETTIETDTETLSKVAKKLSGKRPAQVGHNSGETTDTGGVSGQRLKAFIERVERLEEEKAALAEDVKEVFAEAKAVGFDTKIMRKVIRLRKMDPEKRKEEEEILALYAAAIGLQLSLDV